MERTRGSKLPPNFVPNFVLLFSPTFCLQCFIKRVLLSLVAECPVSKRVRERGGGERGAECL